MLNTMKPVGMRPRLCVMLNAAAATPLYVKPFMLSGNVSPPLTTLPTSVYVFFRSFDEIAFVKIGYGCLGNNVILRALDYLAARLGVKGEAD
jgi:hypothetical protein